MNKHLVGPFEADFSFTNSSDTPVRVYRVDNLTGELSESFGYTTLNQGDTYTSADTWKWFGNRRAAIVDESGQCLGVSVMTEKDMVNDYQITQTFVDDAYTSLEPEPASSPAAPEEAEKDEKSGGSGEGILFIIALIAGFRVTKQCK
jgi:hypothetical protein